MSQLTESMQRRILHHLIERSLIGTMVYPLLWFLVAYTSGIAQRFSIESLLFGAAMVILAALRALLWYADARQLIPDNRTRFFHTLFLLSVLVSAALWGGFIVWINLQGTSVQQQAIILVVVAGLASGGSSALAPRLELALAYLALLLLPIVFFQLALQGQYPEMFLVLFYWVTMCMLAYNQHTYYLKALQTELELEAKNRTLSHLSQIDGLTQLANRTTFDSHLETEWRRGLREGRSLSLLLLDLDHFKQLNDRYGHLTGDEALRRVGTLLNDYARRPGDLAARYGGEEFVLLLPGSSEKATARLAEELRQAIEELRLEVDGKVVNFTVSIGVSSQLPAINRHPEHLIACADRALYAAKGAGRNRVVFSPAAVETASLAG